VCVVRSLLFLFLSLERANALVGTDDSLLLLLQPPLLFIDDDDDRKNIVFSSSFFPSSCICAVVSFHILNSSNSDVSL